MAARERKNMRYVIRCTTESDAGCFWSNQHGWTSLDEATKFTPPEKETLNLPIGGEWAADNASPQIADETEQRAVNIRVLDALARIIEAQDSTALDVAEDDWIEARRALSDGRRELQEQHTGCGNHGCLIDPPKGQGTNAGCQCLSSPITGEKRANIQQALLRNRAQIGALYGVLNAVRVAVKFGRTETVAELLPRMNEVLAKVEAQ
jgi:hypothetical protein